MKTVPLKDLKIKLSFWAHEAFKGQCIEVTKNNKPYIVLMPNVRPGLHYGKNVGKKSLKSALSYEGKKEWLSYLMEDRKET